MTIKITDESSNEPYISDQNIEIITFDGLIHVKMDQIIGQLKAWDSDKQDILYYELENNRYDSNNNVKTGMVQVDRLNGILKATKSLQKSSVIHLKSIVTDKKFITEANLDIGIRNVNFQCLSNSLYAKFAIKMDSNNSNFVSLGYLKRFKDVLGRIMSLQLRGSSQNSTKYDILVVGLRNQEVDLSDLDGIDLDQDLEEEHQMTEVLFSVSKSGSNHCLNSKQAAKLLNKRKAMLVKRMKGTNGSDAKLKLIDLSFNHECSSGSGELKICTTNIALQHCRLKFNGGYNSPMNSCENLTQSKSKFNNY